jgi:hypothetical protein
MNDLEHKVREWRTQVASDIQRDGLGLELVDSAGQVSAEVFRCDRDHTVTVTVYDSAVDADTVLWLRREAVNRLGTFEDGSPLPTQDQWLLGAA